LTLTVENDCHAQTSFINAKIAGELYLFMASQLTDNVSFLVRDGTRNLIRENELITFIDVHKVGDGIQLHAKFLRRADTFCLQEL